MRIDFTLLEKTEIPPQFANKLINSHNKNKLELASSRNFHNTITDVQQQDSASVSFSVDYPFNISKTVSQANMKKQLTHLEAKKALPASTLKFIQTTLHSEFQKQATANSSPRKFEQEAEAKSLQSTDVKRQEQKSSKPVPSINKINKFENSTSISNYRSTFTKEIVKSKVFNFKKKQISRNYQQQSKQLDGVTLRPMLNYTMNSKTAKKVRDKRNLHFKTCQIDVFESLYNDAGINHTKRQMERVMEEQSKTIHIKHSRVKVKSTFTERLQTSIQKQAARKRIAQQKLNFDPETGRKYFLPDTSHSKSSYSLYYNSRRTSIAPPQEGCWPARAAHYSKDSEKLSYSQEMASTLNNSYEKDLNKSLDGKYPIIRRPIEQENKLAELYVELIWSEKGLKEQRLSPQEGKVLKDLLGEFKQYEQKYSKNVNKQVFAALFKEFYAILNLYDKAILLGRLKKVKPTPPSQGGQTSRKKPNPAINLYHASRQYYV